MKDSIDFLMIDPTETENLLAPALPELEAWYTSRENDLALVRDQLDDLARRHEAAYFPVSKMQDNGYDTIPFDVDLHTRLSEKRTLIGIRYTLDRLQSIYRLAVLSSTSFAVDREDAKYLALLKLGQLEVYLGLQAKKAEYIPQNVSEAIESYALEAARLETQMAHSKMNTIVKAADSITSSAPLVAMRDNPATQDLVITDRKFRFITSGLLCVSIGFLLSVAYIIYLISNPAALARFQ